MLDRLSYAFFDFFLVGFDVALLGSSSVIKIEDKNCSLRDSTTFCV
jgi:hypothetical protein